VHETAPLPGCDRERSELAAAAPVAGWRLSGEHPGISAGRRAQGGPGAPSARPVAARASHAAQPVARLGLWAARHHRRRPGTAARPA